MRRSPAFLALAMLLLSIATLHDDDFRTDDRLTGDAAIVVEDAGVGKMDVSLLRVRFVGTDLTSATGATIEGKGTLVRPVM